MSAPAALAARPTKGARYLGSNRYVDAALRVSRDGRALTSAHHGSYVTVDDQAAVDEERCARGRERFKLVPRGRRVRIDRDGRFAFGLRRPGFRLRVRGRFTSGYTVRLVYRVRPASAFRCDPQGKLVLHRRGDPPFSGCRSQRAMTMWASESGRIFDQRKVFWDFRYRAEAYGCLYSVNKRFPLAEDSLAVDDTGEELFGFRMAGPYAGVVGTGSGPVGASDLFTVVDLRDGRTVREYTSLGVKISDFEMNVNVALAWIQSFYPYRLREVWAWDARGMRKLDSGYRIHRDSLTLTGSTLTWIHQGATRSATLY